VPFALPTFTTCTTIEPEVLVLEEADEVVVAARAEATLRAERRVVVNCILTVTKILILNECGDEI